MNLANLQKEAHAIAKGKGWWDKPRAFGDLIALVHSELSEALEAYRLHELETWPSQVGEIPLGVPYELAGVVIRVADMAEWYGENLAPYVSEFDGWVGKLAYEGLVTTFGEWVAVLHMALSDACAAWYVREDRCLWVNALARVVALTQRMAAHYGIDLDSAIEAKLEHNRTRSYRHGGKVL